MTKNDTPLEKDEQKAFFRYAKDLYPFIPLLEHLLFSTLSGSWLHGNSKQRGMQINSEKAQGRKNGVADILCLISKHGNIGMAIEMKRQKGGVVSQDQKDWLAAAEAAGMYTVVANGAGEAIDAFNWYMGIS